MTDFTQSFEVILAAASIQECVQHSYELGAAHAAYTHFPRSACLLHFSTEKVPLDEKCQMSSTLLSKWEFSSVPEVVELECIRCLGQVVMTGVSGDNSALDGNDGNGEDTLKLAPITLNDERPPSSVVDITNLHNADVLAQHHRRQLVNPQGLTPKCQGRVEFQTAPVGSLPRLNVTNDVPADSAADCARKCLEKEGCKLAGFIPTPGHDSASGVCLLTSDEPNESECGLTPDSNSQTSNGNEKSERSPFTSQHASTVPFLISCIRCSNCNYSLSLASPDRELPRFNKSVHVTTIGECAEKCAEKHCTAAQFDPNTLMCSLALLSPSSTPITSECTKETALQTNGIFPVILDCVQCATSAKKTRQAESFPALRFLTRMIFA
ncbi:PAN domain protein [Ditylenchus destructor]|nr:PAN domain protein [Ditylenchus destructor]